MLTRALKEPPSTSFIASMAIGACWLSGTAMTTISTFGSAEILASAGHLKQYEAKGIDSCNPPPTPVFQEYRGFRDELLKEGG